MSTGITTMIDKATARQLVLDTINSPSRLESGQLEMAILDEHTRNEDFGWVFFYDSKLHHETGDWRGLLAGNGPIIVNKESGQLHYCGGSCTPEYSISKYREQIAPGSDVWELVISNDGNNLTTLAHLRNVLELSIQEVGLLRSQLPGIIRVGSYWQLELWHDRLRNRGVVVELRKQYRQR